ncbi:MAG: AAA family ATPase [Candidatus Tectomicrobia bacterium]|nr:AAA family ATPase [Candidatus Tectomicrobia bacterium]
MIIMINGAFGVGKTLIAEHLASILPNSMLYDPEEVGYMVRKITEGIRAGAEDTDDFQDIELWRTLTVDVAEQLHKKYKRTLIIPMTLAYLPYFRDIRAGFSRIDPALYHFCLTASVETIHERLEKRGDMKGSWSFQQTSRCVQAFWSSEFAEHIDTEIRSLQGVVDIILNRVPFS